MTRGVLPVPPTVMLPTTTTGTRARHAGRSFMRKARRRNATKRPKRSVSGRKISAPPPSRCHSDSSQALIGEGCGSAPRLRGERDVVVAGEACAFHHVDDRLMGGAGIGAD